MNIGISIACAAVVFGCIFLFVKSIVNIEQPKKIETVEPIRLKNDEMEYWKQLMLIDYGRSGVFHAERTAINADKVIIELRKRTGGAE
jgi:hypothetical protein